MKESLVNVTLVENRQKEILWNGSIRTRQTKETVNFGLGSILDPGYKVRHN